ncbi:MAG: ferrochelatase [Candidatus Nanopelagicales bacterium]
MSTSYDVILLASFGGPEGPDDVMPFLERVTAGRGVPPERLEEVAHHYLALGGVSPINAQNRALIEALRAELDNRGVRVPIVLGNRNSEPFFDSVLTGLHDAGHRRVLALATSAYPSYSGCRQYREDLGMALERTALADKLEIVKVRPYFDRAGFIQASAELLAQALAAIDPSVATILFTTHSLPAAMAATSGPPDARDARGLYVSSHLAVAEAVAVGAAQRLGRPSPPRWRLVYQSRSGPPQVPWLEPDINDALREEAAAGCRTAVVAPVGFISDHVEVIWDLDAEARQTCAGLGIQMVRVPTAGTHPTFVAGLADLVVAHLEAADGRGGCAPVTGLCSDGCCPNLRVARPVVPGVSVA